MSILLVLILAITMISAGAEGEKKLVILGTSDIHGNIWGFSYEDNKETANNGMARLYTYIKQVRAELIEKINAGEMETLYAKSLNLNDYNK